VEALLKYLTEDTQKRWEPDKNTAWFRLPRNPNMKYQKYLTRAGK
jgi:hypothetical protein